MPQAANIVINDGAGTPVAFTYVPLSKDDKGVMWYEQTTPAPANPLGANRIGISVTRNVPARPGQSLTSEARTVVTFHEPVLEVLSGADSGFTPAPTVAYVESARLEFRLAERSTLQQRKDLRVRVGNFLVNNGVSSQVTPAVSVIDSLLPIY